MSGHELGIVFRIVAGGLSGDVVKVEAYAKMLADELQESDPDSARRLRGLILKEGLKVRANG